MATRACPTCGHDYERADGVSTLPLDSNATEINATEIVGITPLASAVTHNHSTTTVQSGGRSSLVAGAVVVIAILGALAVLLPGQTEPAPDDASSTTLPAPGGPDTETDPRIISPPGLAGPAFDAIVPLFGTNALAEVTGEYRFAYLGRDGIIMIDPTSETSIATTLSISDLPPPNVFTDLAGLSLLSQERTTYGLTKGPAPTVYELYTRGRIIAGPNETMTMVARDNADRTQISVATSLGFSNVATVVPTGSRTLAVPGLGLLVSPPTGRTFVATPAQLELLSEHLIVAASETSHVELRCDAELSCSAWLVDRTTATAVELPEDFGRNQGTLSVSPDGQLVTLTNSDADQIIERDTGTVTLLSATSKGPVSWAPDSSFAVWFDLEASGTQVEVHAPQRSQTETIDLAQLGAGSPVTDTLLLF